MSVLLPSRAYRWNFTVMGLDVSLFVFALSFASRYGVLPLFVSHLTPSNLALGALPALQAIGLLPPLFVAAYTERLRRKQPFILAVTVFERVPFLVLAVATPLLALSNPTPLLWLTFAVLTVNTLAAGIANPAWLDLIARMMPDDWRGRFFGYAFALGGLLGVAGSAGAAYFLRQYDWVIGCALCFAATFAVMIASFFCLLAGREPAPVVVERPLVAPLRLRERVPTVLREDRNLRWYLLAAVLITGAGAATAFFTVDAKRTLALTDGEAGTYAILLLVASTVGNVVWGYAGDRFGHKRVLELGAVMSGLAPALALLARDAAIAGEWGRVGYAAVFLLVGLGTSAVQITALTFIVDFAPPDARPTYIGLATLVQLPFAVGAPLLAAALADWQGYGVVYGLTTLLAFAGALVTARRVRDPRVSPV